MRNTDIKKNLRNSSLLRIQNKNTVLLMILARLCRFHIFKVTHFELWFVF